MISQPMIQFGEIAEVMFQLFSHLDYGRSCLVKSIRRALQTIKCARCVQCACSVIKVRFLLIHVCQVCTFSGARAKRHSFSIPEAIFSLFSSRFTSLSMFTCMP